MNKTKVKGHRRKINGKLIYVKPYKRKLNRGAKTKSNEELIREMKIKKQQQTWLDFLGSDESLDKDEKRVARNMFAVPFFKKKKDLDDYEEEDEEGIFETPMREGFIEDVSDEFQEIESYERTLPSGKTIKVRPYFKVKPLIERKETDKILREFRKQNPEGGLISERDKILKEKLDERRKEKEKLKKRFRI